MCAAQTRNIMSEAKVKFSKKSLVSDETMMKTCMFGYPLKYLSKTKKVGIYFFPSLGRSAVKGGYSPRSAMTWYIFVGGLFCELPKKVSEGGFGHQIPVFHKEINFQVLYKFIFP